MHNVKQWSFVRQNWQEENILSRKTTFCEFSLQTTKKKVIKWSSKIISGLKLKILLSGTDYFIPQLEMRSKNANITERNSTLPPWC